MDQSSEPNCSSTIEVHNDQTCEVQITPSNQTVQINTPTTISLRSTPATPRSFYLSGAVASHETANKSICSSPLILRPSPLSPVMRQVRSNLPSHNSFVASGQPATLFIQALSKLSESSLSLAVLTRLKSSTFNNSPVINNGPVINNSPIRSGEITPPDSLTSAPPSYSFVLRQMAARRRPRLMGTFIPSPSFVQHTPPPNYATAFDIYLDNSVPPPTTRVYNFGFASMPAVCPTCGFTGMTVVTTKITLCTHMCAFLLCLFCCWICVPLPYILRSCKDVYHHCRGCRNYLGMYCPTNPDNIQFP